MFSRIHIIAVVACVGIGMGTVPQFSLASSSNLGRDLLAFFRPNHGPVATNDVPSNTAAAVSYHRLARTFVAQNDVHRANTNFSLALQNAAPRQVASIAIDYATFLTDIGDLHRAELMLRQALTQSPDDTEIIRMLARCLVRQDKMAEGLRHFRSIGTEAEARAEIAAIYRAQGNTDMLAAVEQRWGSARPDMVRPATVSTVVRPEPTRVAVAPRPTTAPPLPGAGAVRTSAPATAAPDEVAVVTAAAVAPPLSRSEFLDNRVPIPVPGPAPLLAARAGTSSASVPVAAQPVSERPVLANTVRLAPAPMSVVPEVEVKETPRPTTTIQPRRHYVIGAGTFADLEALLPTIRPAAATVPARGTR